MFDEICSKYIGNDLKCISYIDEIDLYLNDNEQLPKFCFNLPYTITKKGYINDQYDLEKKKNLLIHIRELGTGLTLSGESLEKSNSLIEHYVKVQSIAPLWIIPNALTLGELKILFSILDSDSQKKIISSFYKIDDYKKISTAHILKFLGTVEIIRRIRNVVNHYEPIFPLLAFELKKYKKINESQMYTVLSFLKSNFDTSNLIENNKLSINFETNNYNAKNMKIIDMMQEIIEKRQNKK